MARLSPNISVKLKSGILQLYFTFRTYAEKDGNKKVYRDFYARIPLLSDIEKPKTVWNINKNSFKHTFLSSVNGIAIETTLKKEIKDYSDLCIEFIASNGVPPKGIKELENFRNSRAKKTSTLTEVFDVMLKLRNYSKSEKSKINITRGLVESFEDKNHVINTEFMNAARNHKSIIIHFVHELLRKNKNLSINTVRDKLEKITTVCNHAVEENILKNNQVIKIKFPKDFKSKRSGDQSLSLEYSDCIRLVKYEPKNKQEILAKSLILLNIFSGLRYSDIPKILKASNQKKSSNDNNFLYITQTKTNDKVSIPSLFIDLIIPKLPKSYKIPANKTLNDYYKGLIENAIPDKTVHISHTRVFKNGDDYTVKEVEEKVPLFKGFTSKSCRKTNYLFNIEMGLSQAQSDALLGHIQSSSSSEASYKPDDYISAQLFIDKICHLYKSSGHYTELIRELKKNSAWTVRN